MRVFRDPGKIHVLQIVLSNLVQIPIFLSIVNVLQSFFLFFFYFFFYFFFFIFFLNYVYPDLIEFLWFMVTVCILPLLSQPIFLIFSNLNFRMFLIWITLLCSNPIFAYHCLSILNIFKMRIESVFIETFSIQYRFVKCCISRRLYLISRLSLFFFIFVVVYNCKSL